MTIKNDISQLVVLNDIMSKMNMLKSDIIPESEVRNIIDATANVASNVHSTNGSYGAAYTTRPLVPATGSVLDFSQSYLYDVFNHNFAIYLNSNIYSDIYMLYGPVGSATIYNALYFLIDNATIWSTIYNRTEARIASLALPSSEVNYSNEFASIDKLLESKHSPMKIIKIPQYSGFTYTGGTNRDLYYKCYIYKLRFDLTTDLNSLCVPFSNIDYTCYNYGALSIRTLFDNIHQAMHYFVLPYSTSISYAAAEQAPAANINKPIALQSGNSILTLNPVQWAMNSPVVSLGGTNGWYLDMKGLEQWIPIALPIQMSLTFGASVGNMSTSCSIANNTGLTVNPSVTPTNATDLTNAKFASIPIVFCLNPSTTNDGRDYTYCFELLESQIVQVTFDIEPASKQALANYFGSMQKVPLPIQVFSTSELNNGTVGPTSGSNTMPPTTLLASISGNNYADIILTLSPTDSPSCFINPYAQQYTAMLNGATINQVPYPKTNNRAIKDYCDACCDTDTEEVNTDFLYSLQFPPELNGHYNPGSVTQSTFTEPGQYFTDGDFKRLKTLNWDSSMTKYVKNPNGFMHVFQLEIPESYHTGFSIVELQAVTSTFKFNGTYNSTYNALTNANEYRFINKEKQYDDNVKQCALYSDTNLTIPSYVNRDCVFRVTALCDALIYLNYDAGIDMCTGGGLSYAAPYVDA